MFEQGDMSSYIESPNGYQVDRRLEFNYGYPKDHPGWINPGRMQYNNTLEFYHNFQNGESVSYVHHRGVVIFFHNGEMYKILRHELRGLIKEISELPRPVDPVPLPLQESPDVTD